MLYWVVLLVTMLATQSTGPTQPGKTDSTITGPRPVPVPTCGPGATGGDC